MEKNVGGPEQAFCDDTGDVVDRPTTCVMLQTAQPGGGVPSRNRICDNLKMRFGWLLILGPILSDPSSLPAGGLTSMLGSPGGNDASKESPSLVANPPHVVLGALAEAASVGRRTPNQDSVDRSVPQTLASAVTWLERRSWQMIRDCRRTMKSGIAAFPPQVGGGYEAFWLRDYAYMLEGNSAAFTDQELKDSYRFFLKGQRADGAMVDCIRFDGTPCYMPGYGTLGRNPVADGPQFMVDVAWHTFRKTRDANLIADTMDALIKGMKALPRNPATGLVYIKPGSEHDRCPYGFTDAIRKQGDELFCSLLFVQAGRQLSELLEVVNRPADAAYWRGQAQQVTRTIRQVFWDDSSGLFHAATVVCNQPDIWGSAFAVYLGVAAPEQAQRIAGYFAEHYGQIVKRGQLRHLPGGMFWEQTIGVKPGTYQNGAYWATPIGWFVYAIDLAAPALANQTIVDLVRDFITTGDENECVNDGYSNVSRYVASVALPLAGILAMEQRRADQARAVVLRPEAFRHYVQNFNQLDRETVVDHIPNSAAWDWMTRNVPMFECSDKDLEEIYYFRWWTYRKHIKPTPAGFIITEFLPEVPWSGKYNSINCAAGHHFYEGRWLHDPQYLNDYARFWFHDGGEPRKYSFWAADSLYARSLVLGDFRLPKELLPELMANYKAWEQDHLDPDTGLFWQEDGNDGMEVSVGGSGCRATINSYQYGDALAISRIGELNGQPELARAWRDKAAALRDLVQKKLWDPQARFFKVLPRGKNSLVNVRELHGYTPWYFNLPGPDKSVAWSQLMDPEGFYAPFGPTTAEQRNPGFAVAYSGHECQWNGPSWPYATSVTLTAFANLLNNYKQHVVGKSDYWKIFQCYLRSHRFRQIPPPQQAGVEPVDRVEDPRPWIDENLNPYTGDWIARTLLKERHQPPDARGKDYNHSTFCDLVITGLVGLRPRADETLEVNPLIPEGTWDYFCLDQVLYHGRVITVLYDKTGRRYGRGTGLMVLVDGKQVAHSKLLQRVTAHLPPQDRARDSRSP